MEFEKGMPLTDVNKPIESVLFNKGGLCPS
jgi:hypothetical protein